MAKIYIIKLSTNRTLSDMMKRLEPVGTVISFREAEALETAVPGINGVAAPIIRVQRQYTNPEAVKAARSKAMMDVANKRRDDVYPVLSEYLRNHQHVPLEQIVAFLNQSSVRPLRNGPWNNYNIKPYLDYTLAKMTSPNEPSISLHNSEQA